MPQRSPFLPLFSAKFSYNMKEEQNGQFSYYLYLYFLILVLPLLSLWAALFLNNKSKHAKRESSLENAMFWIFITIAGIGFVLWLVVFAFILLIWCHYGPAPHSDCSPRRFLIHPDKKGVLGFTPAPYRLLP